MPKAMVVEMTKKIFRSVFLASASVLLASLVLIIGVLYGYFDSMQKSRLKSELVLASAGTEKGGKDYLGSIGTTDCRLTLVDRDGTVLFDSMNDASEMQNHAGAPEIKAAFEYGDGESERFSSTMTEKRIYRAHRLSDGTVLRASVSRTTVPLLIAGMLQPLALIFIFALILSWVLARRVSAKAVAPLNSIDLDRPLENNVYDELSPLLTHIERQQKKINSQKAELENRRREFYAVIENMSEGLVLLSTKKTVLSINPAAEKFFGTDGSCVGRNFIEIERGRDIERAIDLASESGHTELSLGRDGGEYRLNISRIDSGEGAVGLALLTFDVTDRVFAERNRREFTANVSHELKTPLHSIMGSAELLENGMVADADVPRFVGRIRAEAARLVSLIDDIIRLSQLDEGGEMPKETADLYEIAEEEVSRLRDEAEKKNVKLNLTGEVAIVNGVSRLLHEIVFNLCDNAIKYNRDGGSVSVDVKASDDGAVLTVSDTGIGIAPEDRQRVFERFYRVDKSRSKEVGGTGLGLSIVKHAVMDMGGSINLESTFGEGSTFTVTFLGANAQGAR